MSDYESADDYERPYFFGTCTCEHDEDEHGWGSCHVEDCPCEAGWEG